jgi:23S rRNA pseudouridine1911/1915/1917 synthase
MTEQMKVEDLIILHEDNHVIVVLKPQNVPSCEDESKDKDLLTVIKEYIKIKSNKPGNVYVGLVHRLDRPTGGVMVYAKSSKAAARLSEQMKTGDFEKKYYTVLVGSPREKKATLTNYMKKNPINNMVYVCPQTVEGAKFAELEYKVIEEKGGLSFTEVTLHTGRSHQIRVQMSNISTPVYGDMRYGGENAKKGKLALWATSLAFTHPVSKERLCFKVEPPKDLLPWKNFDTSKAVDLY